MGDTRSLVQRLSIASVVLVVGVAAIVLGEDMLKLLFTVGAQEGSLMPIVFGAIAVLVLTYVTFLSLSIRSTSSSLATKMNEDLLVSRDQFQVLYDSSPVPYLIVTPDGDITNPNEAACTLFQLPREALEGSNLFSSITDAKEDAIGIRERLKHSLSAERQEIVLTIGNGSERWVLFSMHEVNTAGEYTHMGLVTMVDITGQKDIERKKTEFLSLASHQLRTPLSRIRWYADMLEESTLDAKQKKYLDSLYRANLLMIETVNTLLNMTRLELGTLDVEVQTFNISEHLKGIVDDYRKLASDKEISLTASIPEGVEVASDPKLVRVVVDNLLTNALRYTQKGGTVSLAFAQNEAEHSMHIDVVDTGCGIPEKDQSKIFTKQFRANNAKAMSNDGTGLGMYMTHALLEIMGGTISFVSREGQGTHFTVVLPTHDKSA